MPASPSFDLNSDFGEGYGAWIMGEDAAMLDIVTGAKIACGGLAIIAGAQCLVTTLRMPTGWRIIGRFPTRFLLDDPAWPFLFDVGDTIQFRRIDRATFDAKSANR